MQFTFGKKESQLIKGVAIIAMFYHHFFGFPTWRTTDCFFFKTYIGERCIESDIASFCKICVAIYAFVSGYALFVKNYSLKNIKLLLKRILTFLCGYWMICFVFILFGIMFNEPFPPLERFVLQCFGVSTATVFNWDYFDAIHPVFAWYVSFHILFIIFSPLLAKLCRYNFLIDLFLITAILFGVNYLSYSILPENFSVINILIKTFATWGHIGMIGFLFAKYGVFNYIHTVLSKYLGDIMQFILLVFVIGYIYYLWTYEGKIFMFENDNIKVSYFAIYTPVFIYAIIYIINYINCRVINSILVCLSRESTNMWFLHGLFFTPKKTIQWIAYLPRHPLFILIWTLFLMYCCSVVIRKIIESISSIVEKHVCKKSINKRRKK